jgi:hypothetical protein
MGDLPIGSESRRAIGTLDQTGHCQLRHVSNIGVGVMNSRRFITYPKEG